MEERSKVLTIINIITNIMASVIILIALINKNRREKQ